MPGYLRKIGCMQRTWLTLMLILLLLSVIISSGRLVPSVCLLVTNQSYHRRVFLHILLRFYAPADLLNRFVIWIYFCFFFVSVFVFFLLVPCVRNNNK